MRRLPRVRAHCAHSSAGSLRNAAARIGPQRQKRTCVPTHICSVKARRACGSIPLRRIVPVEYPRVPSSEPLVVAVDSHRCADRIDSIDQAPTCMTSLLTSPLRALRCAHRVRAVEFVAPCMQHATYYLTLRHSLCDLATLACRMPLVRSP